MKKKVVRKKPAISSRPVRLLDPAKIIERTVNRLGGPELVEKKFEAFMKLQYEMLETIGIEGPDDLMEFMSRYDKAEEWIKLAGSRPSLKKREQLTALVADVFQFVCMLTCLTMARRGVGELTQREVQKLFRQRGRSH